MAEENKPTMVLDGSIFKINVKGETFTCSIQEVETIILKPELEIILQPLATTPPTPQKTLPKPVQREENEFVTVFRTKEELIQAVGFDPTRSRY
jgi:hypothetical protein